MIEYDSIEDESMEEDSTTDGSIEEKISNLGDAAEKLRELYREKNLVEITSSGIRRRYEDGEFYIDDSGLYKLLGGVSVFGGIVAAASYHSSVPLLAFIAAPALRGIHEIARYLTYKLRTSKTEENIPKIKKSIDEVTAKRKELLRDRYVEKHGEEDVLAFAGDIFEDVKTGGCGCKRHGARDAFNELVCRIDEETKRDVLCSDSEKEINRAEIIVRAYLKLQNDLHSYCRVTDSTITNSNKKIVEKTLGEAEKLKEITSNEDISSLLRTLHSSIYKQEMSTHAEEIYPKIYGT